MFINIFIIPTVYLMINLLLNFDRICSAVIKSHPMRSNVLKTNLDKSLPSIQDIQTALVKLRQICVIGEQSHSLFSLCLL